MELLEDGCATAEHVADVMEPPKEYNYTTEDFMGTEPYDHLYSFASVPFMFQIQTLNKIAAIGLKHKNHSFPIRAERKSMGFWLCHTILF